jgi:ribosomal protein S24E
LKLDLTSVKKNPLFNRQEVEFKVEQAATPTRSAVKIELAVALRVELNQVYVRAIETLSGTHTTVGSAHVYDDPEQALKVEPKYIIERNAKAVPPEPESEPEPEPEAAEEEAPVEEPAEEPVEEE